jgi:hypothetical protein
VAEPQIYLSQEWYDCFPVEQVGKVLSYVSATWTDLIMRFPLKHHAQESEPNLTKSLSDHLDDVVRRRLAGIGGRFHSERPVNDRDATGRRKQLGRTDIEYHLPRDGRATLVLEFKKLKGANNWRQAYRNKGVLKFVNGPYAKTEMIGVMCGFISSDHAVEVAAVRASIERSRIKLGCVANGAGAHIIDPSEIAPGIAAFDTKHTRPMTVSSSPIQLGHLFLAISAEAPP